MRRDVQGIHGIGSCNEDGERFLEFCAVNNLTIMNTWFEKGQVNLGTWTHPATNQSHTIDSVLMRNGQRRLCCDGIQKCMLLVQSSHGERKTKDIQLARKRRKKCETHFPLAHS